jgi:putative FmdB family regulatory protein
MPIYEYRCENKDCGIKIECLQKITDEPMKVCPECKVPSLKRLMSAAGFRLKGGGWYETDFKTDQAKKKNLSGDNADSGTAKPKEAEPNKTKEAATTKVDSAVKGTESSAVSSGGKSQTTSE